MINTQEPSGKPGQAPTRFIRTQATTCNGCFTFTRPLPFGPVIIDDDGAHLGTHPHRARVRGCAGRWAGGCVAGRVPRRLCAEGSEFPIDCVGAPPSVWRKYLGAQSMGIVATTS